MNARFQKVCAALVVFVAAGSTSLAETSNSSRMSQVRHACAVVLGLDPSEEPYAVCVRSLDSNFSQYDQADFARSQDSVGQVSSIPAPVTQRTEAR
jgi:hypothetical protein